MCAVLKLWGEISSDSILHNGPSTAIAKKKNGNNMYYFNT